MSPRCTICGRTDRVAIDADVAAGAEYNYRPTQEKGELPGNSSFYRDETGAVFHTYSAYARGAEEVASTYMLLDIAPLGRNEGGPQPMAWVRHHDRYEGTQAGSCCCT